MASPSRRSRGQEDPATADLGLIDSLVQLSFLIQATLTRIAAAYELSVVQIRLLGALRDRRPGMNELATLLGLDKSSVTGLVDRAERRGLLKRSVSSRDRRVYEVGLTARGRAIADRVGAEFACEAGRLTQGLEPREQKLLSELITAVLLTDAGERGIELFPTRSSPRARAQRQQAD